MLGYVTVADRQVAAFRKWPELRLQEERTEIITIGSDTFIAVTVVGWRTPDDPLPARATCWEIYPGRTPFTRGSEQANAATSAKGRLFGLMLPEFGTASMEEVRNRSAENDLQFKQPASKPVKQQAQGQVYNEPDPVRAIPRPSADAVNQPASQAQVGKLRAMMRANGINDWQPPEGFSKLAASQLIDEIQTELSRKGLE